MTRPDVALGGIDIGAGYVEIITGARLGDSGGAIRSRHAEEFVHNNQLLLVNFTFRAIITS